jgi:hypothetical protein
MWLVNSDIFLRCKFTVGATTCLICKTDKKYILRLFCGMEVDDVTRGDEMTRGRNDQGTKWPGTKWKGTNRRVTLAARRRCRHDLAKTLKGFRFFPEQICLIVLFANVAAYIYPSWSIHLTQAIPTPTRAKKQRRTQDADAGQSLLMSITLFSCP